MTAQLGRYLVRDIHPWEGAKIFAMTGDPDVMRYMGFAVHTAVDQATALIAQYQNSPSRFQAICFTDDPTDILGIVGLEVRGHQATITLMLCRGWKTRGIGRDFGYPFVQWIFTHPTIWRVWSYVHVDNMPGQRVTERIGALKEGRLQRFEFFPNVSDEPQDVYVYGIVRD